MTESHKVSITRRGFLKTGAAAAAAPLLARAPLGHAQARGTKVLDFQTGADVAKAEQEGEVVYYGHDGEAGIGTLLDAFKKDFPKIKTSYVRLQTGALYAKITAERWPGAMASTCCSSPTSRRRSTSRRRAGTSSTSRRSTPRIGPSTSRAPPGYYGWGGVTFAGSPTTAPGCRRSRRRRGGRTSSTRPSRTGSARSSPRRACSMRSGTRCGSSMATSSGRSSPSSAQGVRCARPAVRPALEGRGPHVRARRVRRVDAASGEGRGHRVRGAADGLPATSFFIGVVNRAPHPEAAKLFVDWRCPARPGRLPEREDPSLWVARDRRGGDADGEAPGGLQAPVPHGLERLRGQPPRVREGVERDHGALSPASWTLVARARSWRPGPRLVSLVVGGAAAAAVLYPIAYLIQASLSVGDPQARRRRRTGSTTSPASAATPTSSATRSWWRAWRPSWPSWWGSLWVDPVATRPGRAALEHLMAMPY